MAPKNLGAQAFELRSRTPYFGGPGPGTLNKYSVHWPFFADKWLAGRPRKISNVTFSLFTPPH
jgi:hypothetical protein